jgi:hypothetical protein
MQQVRTSLRETKEQTAEIKRLEVLRRKMEFFEQGQ